MSDPSSLRKLWFTRLGLVGIIALMGMTAGCGEDDATTSGSIADRNDSGLFTIAVIPKGTSHEFWKSVEAGARKAESELEDVEVIWQGPLKESDRERQINIVGNFINAKVDGIVLAPLDAQALMRPVNEAAEAGVPVVIMDSGLNAEPGEGYISFVATDNDAGGRLAAKRMGELLGGSGRVIVMRYVLGSASTTRREEGFLAGLKEQYPDIKIVSADQFAGPSKEEAFDLAETLLDQFGEIDGIFAPCEPTIFGILRALESRDLAGRVKVVGFDASDKLVDAMKQGHLHGLVLQDPVNIGYLGVKTMVDHLHERNVDPRIDTGIALATPDNMDEPRIHRLLHPLAHAEQP